ncbi:MAG: sigma-70 family RNA polymerase sigma factor [Haliangiales bacterium]
MSIDDAELLDAWRAGDNRAGERLFERYYESLERSFVGKLPGHELEDLIQETFIACVRGCDKLRDKSRFRPYLFGIAYRKFADYLRRKSRARGQVVDLDETSIAECAPGPLSELAGQQELVLLLKALRAIPINFQLILELHYWERMTTADIASVLNKPVGTVRRHLGRARELLKDAMASLAGSPQLLLNTLTRLDDWVELCRDQVCELTAAQEVSSSSFSESHSESHAS